MKKFQKLAKTIILRRPGLGYWGSVFLGVLTVLILFLNAQQIECCIDSHECSSDEDSVSCNGTCPCHIVMTIEKHAPFTIIRSPEKSLRLKDHVPSSAFLEGIERPPESYSLSS